MSTIYKTEQKEVQHVVDIICDKCGRSCIGEFNFCGVRFNISGGYDSPIFPDDETVRQYHVCEYCMHEWMSTWPTDYLVIGDASNREEGEKDESK